MKLGIIGGGNIGSAILRGVMKAGRIAAGEAVVMFAGGLTILRVVFKNERFRIFFESMN